MKNNFRRSIRHKIRWAIILFMPLVLSLLTSIINQIQENTYRVGVIDSQVNMEQICTKLNGMDQINAKQANLSTYHTDLIMGTYDFIIDYSKGWSEEVIISCKTNQEEHEFYEFIMKQGTSNQAQYSMSSDNSKKSAMSQATGFLMTLFLIMAVLHGGMYLRDKSHGLIMRYCYAPRYKFSYVTGNLCFMFLITLIQVTASFLLLCVVNDTWLPLSVCMKSIGLISMIASIFAIVICAFCKNDTQASIVASTIATLCMIVGGTFVPIESMPQILQVISKISPVRWCMDLVTIL